MCFFIHSSFECLSVPNSVWSYVHRYVRRLSVHLFVFSFWSLSFCEESLCFLLLWFLCYLLWYGSFAITFILMFVAFFFALCCCCFISFPKLPPPIRPWPNREESLSFSLFTSYLPIFIYLNYKHASNPSTCPSVRLSIGQIPTSHSIHSFSNLELVMIKKKKITKEIDHHWEMLFWWN